MNFFKYIDVFGLLGKDERRIISKHLWNFGENVLEIWWLID